MFNNARVFPLSPLTALRGVDRLFDALDPFRGGARLTASGFPALNVWEADDVVFAEAELPGMKLDDVELLVVGNELTIRGRRPAEADGNYAWHRKERAAGEFERVIALPCEVNAGKVEATLKDGVLTIRMPKAETARARKIEVRMG